MRCRTRSTSWSTRQSSPAARRTGSCPSRGTRAVSSPSTHVSRRARRRAPSPTRSTLPEILEVEAARVVLDARALGREIARVHAPDAWFLKRGTTAAALRHALIGSSFTAARRIGKQIVLDTSTPTVRLGVHLGMSGRVIVDGAEAGDLLVDEVLWRAAIDPARLAVDVDAAERKTLHRSIRVALRVLGRRGGSHTGDMPRDVDVPCPRDGGALQRRTIAGRTTYSCRVHQ